MNEMKFDEQSRLEWLDILRVFGCICVLIYHVINGLIKDGMDVNNGLAFLSDMISLFHVPIFFVISGYLYYRYSDLSKNAEQINVFGKTYGKLIKKKFIGLGVPYFVFSILYIVLSSFIASEMHTAYGFGAIVRLLWEPVAQYWYLLVLMYLFALVPLIQFVLRDIRYVFLFAVILKVITIYFNIPVIGETLSMLIFFCLGMGFCSIEENIIINKKIAAVSLFVTIGLSYLIYTFEKNDNLTIFIRSVISVLFLMEFVAIAYNAKSKLLISITSKISKYTLHIYLIHTWITGVFRVVLKKLNVYDCWVHTLFGIILGFSLSLLVATFIKKIDLFNVFCEPIKVIKGRKKLDN